MLCRKKCVIFQSNAPCTCTLYTFWGLGITPKTPSGGHASLATTQQFQRVTLRNSLADPRDPRLVPPPMVNPGSATGIVGFCYLHFALFECPCTVLRDTYIAMNVKIYLSNMQMSPMNLFC